MNVNHLLRIHKNDLVNSKNLHIVTRQGTKICKDRIITNDAILTNQHYLDLKMKNQVFNDAIDVFKK